MNYQIKRATLEEKEILNNLMQFYMYDFSEYMDLHLEENGKFNDYPLNDYWTEDSNFPYLLTLNGKNAGFVLVKLKNRDDDLYFSIAEFFIIKKYRRVGLGRLVAKDIFNIHKGQWEVYQIDNNEPAQRFWKKVIEEYTGGKFTERIEAGRKTQVFVNRVES
ncbi:MULTISPECIES: GNAT family N-acetyltransferase [unclassified Paenibacillus]|uniref:GNAT family N-acetyltransferase n=2 Tax=Paenibacillus TaxID=44249 RepID=UPI0030CEFEE8